ncbi:MAG: hypothetical protein OYH76_19145 [Defluviicoccus sp.]|nr:hypothetical protein [Defluviicoccus sp.]MDE0278017.1 hypothetical protein [Defluviicoccus sp.]
MKRERPLDPDVATVMASACSLAWWGRWSFAMSVFSIAFLGALSLDGALKGSVVPAGQAIGVVFGYVVIWVCGAAYGDCEGLANSVAESEAFKGVAVLRFALLFLGLSLAAWWMPGGPRLGEAVLTGGLWLGAWCEGACVGRIARIHGFSLWKALRVSGRIVFGRRPPERTPMMEAPR